MGGGGDDVDGGGRDVGQVDADLAGGVADLQGDRFRGQEGVHGVLIICAETSLWWGRDWGRIGGMRAGDTGAR